MSASEDTIQNSIAALVDRFQTPFFAELLQICDDSKRLMMGLYFVEKGCFLHCNRPLQNFLGDYGKEFMSRGWEFWLTKVPQADKAYLQNKINSFFRIPYKEQFINLKYHIIDKFGNCVFLKHEIFLHRLGCHLVATNYFFDITEKERAENFILLKSTTRNPRFTQNQLLTISPREKQVLRLIAEGYSSKEIADKLFISNHTAVSHRKNLIVKFQVKNTAHLVNKAARLVIL